MWGIVTLRPTNNNQADGKISSRTGRSQGQEEQRTAEHILASPSLPDGATGGSRAIAKLCLTFWTQWTAARQVSLSFTISAARSNHVH